MDIFLNVAGGLKINEPAADLSVAASLISSFSKIALPKKPIVFGEIGLSGEIRSVPQVNARLKEASKLGFTEAIIPTTRRDTNSQKKGRIKTKQSGLAIKEISKLEDLLSLFRMLNNV